LPTQDRAPPWGRTLAIAIAIVLSVPHSARAAVPPPPDAKGEIVVGDRQPLVMVVFTSKGSEALQTHISEILRVAAEVLKKRTNLVLLSAEQAGADPTKIRDCGTSHRFTCWVKTVRNDYEREELRLPDGGFMPYSEHLADLKAHGTTYAKYLVVLGIYPDPGKADRVSAVLINTDEALQRFHEAYRNRPDWEDRVEDEIFERGAQARPDSVQVSNADGLRTYFEKLFGEELRASFEKSGNFEPYGQIDVQTDAPGLLIDLDGKVVGQTKPGQTRIAEVAPGVRKIGFEDPAKTWNRYETQIEVKRGDVLSVRPMLVRAPSSGGVRQLTFWGGVGVAAIGAAITTYAAAQKSKYVYLVPCTNPGGAGCVPAPPSGFASLCDLGSGGPSCVNGSKGVVGAPLGYSILGMGAAWALGTEFLDDKEDIPWRSLLIGVAVGGVTYAISAAADKR
jgi:hypothetical protein